MTYDRVCRLNGPDKGRLCRIVVRAPARRDHLGKAIINTGDHLVTIEWSDGTLAVVAAQDIPPVTSTPGRQAINAASDGLTRQQRSAKLQREWRERQKARKVASP